MTLSDVRNPLNAPRSPGSSCLRHLSDFFLERCQPLPGQ